MPPMGDFTALLDAEGLQREIVEHLGLDAGEVRRRWEAERRQTGSQVVAECARFGVTPHVHDAAMERLYREGTGFIFETLAYWIREERQAWTARGLARLNAYCAERDIAAGELRLVMLGDGAGSDTLRLMQAGFRPHYFDVPGSRTAAFARARFAARKAPVSWVERYEALLGGPYDTVWCFDVLEHLPDLPGAVRDLAAMLRPGGLALITESCQVVTPQLPTHLRINQPYAARIPQLFRDAGLYLHHYTRGTDFRPCEYRKAAAPAWRVRLRSWRLAGRIQRRRREPDSA